MCAVETIKSPLWLLLPCGYFALRATSPCGLPRFPCWTWKVHLNIQNFLALEVQTASRCWQHLSLSHSGKMPGHHFYPRRNMSKCRDWRYNQLRLSTHDASPITFQLRGTRLDVIGLAPCVLISLNIWTFGKFLTLHVTSSLYTHTHVRFAHSLDTNMVPYILITSYHLANHSYQWNSLTL